METRKIAFNIYANSDEEAERGRKAITQFINIMGQHGAKVSGDKLYEAISLPGSNGLNLPRICFKVVFFFKVIYFRSVTI